MEHHTAKQLRIMKLFLNQGTNAGEALGGDSVLDSGSDSEPGEPDEWFIANEHMALYEKLGKIKFHPCTSESNPSLLILKYV